MPDASLVIKILADTSSAQTNVNQLVGALGKVTGIGVAGATGAALVQASMTQQDAMARIQTAYNNTDFAPGTAKFKAAHDFIVDESTKLATNFTDLAGVYAQGARFLDDFGNRLPTDKVQEYTETMTRLAKVSTDALAPTQIGQSVDVIEKLFGKTDFATTGSEISALAGMHNQGEGPTLAGAIAIGQYGAQLGVTKEQALGISSYLADLGASGGLGSGGPGQSGASIGRMLMLMSQSADTVLDPTQSYKQVQKQREADEHVDDLASNLDIAEARRSEMYDSRGRLKRNYLRHPSEVMAADANIAKMHRELGDAQADRGHLNDATADLATGRGTMNIAAMAKTVGEDSTQYAEEFRGDPMGTMLKWTAALNSLDPTKREQAIRAAGVSRTRDLKTTGLLDYRPEVLQSYLDTAESQKNNPTDLTTRSNIPLSTTSAKLTDAANAANGGMANLGNGPREAIDAGTQKLLDGLHGNSDGLTKLADALTGNQLTGDIAAAVVAGGIGLLTSTVPSIIAGVLAGKAVGGAAAAATGGTVGANAAATGGGLIAAGGSIATAAGITAAATLPIAEAVAYKAQTSAMQDESKALVAGLSTMQRSALDSKLRDMGQTGADTDVAPGLLRQTMHDMNMPIAVTATVNTTVNASNQNVDAGQITQQVYAAVINGIQQAWQHAQNAPSSQLGGAR